MYGCRKRVISNTIKKFLGINSQEFSCWHSAGLAGDQSHIAGLWALGTLFHCEFDLLAFFEVLEAFTLDGGEVDKDVRAALTGDKAVAFASIEPFDCADDTI
jgi:hypothetical protein